MTIYTPIIAACLALLVPGSALSQTSLATLIRTATHSFPALSDVREVVDTDGLCGGGLTAPGLYCTQANLIYLAQDPNEARRLYTLAHLYGHAIQVKYGLADIALSRIRADGSRELDVRTKVTSQVECMAGVLLARAGIAMPPLTELFGSEPMTGSHWGRNPVARGPAVSIGFQVRAEWFATGYGAADPAACTVGDLPADLIVAADKWPAG